MFVVLCAYLQFVYLISIFTENGSMTFVECCRYLLFFSLNAERKGYSKFYLNRWRKKNCRPTTLQFFYKCTIFLDNVMPRWELTYTCERVFVLFFFWLQYIHVPFASICLTFDESSLHTLTTAYTICIYLIYIIYFMFRIGITEIGKERRWTRGESILF